MNRVVIELDEKGVFQKVSSDVEIEFYCFQPTSKEPLYHYRSVEVGVEKVRDLIKDEPVFYGGEDELVDTESCKPTLSIV